MGVSHVNYPRKLFLEMEVALVCLKMTSNGMSTNAQKSVGRMPQFGTSQVSYQI